MSGKNLTFKLVMDADTKDYVSNTKQAQDVTVKVFDTIKSEAQKVKVTELVQGLHEATKQITDLGDKSTISGTKIREMSMQSQQMVASLNNELVGAQAELVRLSQSKASPTDISNAINRVADLKSSIQDVQAAFGSYQSVATNAMTGLDKATSEVIAELQRFTTLDLTEITTEVQNVTRAIESMGDGAVISTKEVERISTVGAAAIDSLERELLSARNAWQALIDAGDNVTLEELNAAKERVTSLERALNLADNSMSDFRAATQQAVPIVDSLDHALDGTNQELAETGATSEAVAHNIEGLKTGFTALTSALAALGIGVTAQEMAQTTDNYKNLIATLKIAVGEYGNLEQALDDVIAVAIRTNSNLEATANLYAKLLKAGKEFKFTQKDALQLTEVINMAIQVSGTSAESAEAALFQLNQAIGSGVLRGEEYASVLEQAPRLAEAMADGLGVTIGKLKEFADNGKLTTDVVTKALLSQTRTISAEFEKFPLTIGKSTENLKTSWMVYLGELDRTHGISQRVAEAIKYIAENLDQLVSTLTFAAQAFIAYKALGMAAVFLDKANSVRAASLAVQQETVAVVANTQAQLANANAARANAVAHSGIKASIETALPTFSRMSSGLTGVISRFGAYGAAAAGVIVAGSMLKDVFVDVGEAAGEGAAKLWMWATGAKSLEQAEKELAAQEEASKKKAEEAAEAHKRKAAATELAKNAALGLNEASKQMVDEFDKQVKAGESVVNVLENIAKSFNFDTTTGINNGITALIALQTQGKATGEQIQAALSGILKDEDLVAFQGKLAAIPVNIEKQIEATNAKVKAKQVELDNWKKANQDMEYRAWLKSVAKYQDDITKLQAEASSLHVQYANSVKSAAMVQGAVLDEAIRRTGLSYEELKGESTEAFTKANNDVRILVQNLGELEGEGVDVSRALGASISNAIDTSTNQQELEELKKRIESLRSKLGEKVADGLLRQAEQQLIDLKERTDEATAGVNSVAEAFSVFGMETPEQLKVVAAKYKEAFDTLKSSGSATLNQQQEAFKQYAEKAIAANKGVADSTILSQARMLDMKVEVDSTGKASVSAMNDLTSANDRVGDSARLAISGYRELGDAARQEAKSSIEAWNEMMDARSKAEKENKTQRVGADFTTYNVSDIQSKLSGMGYDEAEAAKIAKNILNQGLEIDKNKARDARARGDEYTAKAFEKLLNNGQTSAFGTQKVNELLARYMSGQGSATAGTKSSAINALAPEVNVAVPTTNVEQSKERVVQNNITINGKTISVPVTESSQGSFDEFLSELEQLKRAM
ncbi:tape measure protein [Acinetobacter tandoii]|uniref:tape measure protein n=1 Tax=Acinetobacter tandoii TaxID=202954 RepID=UPI004045EADC